MFRKIHFLTCIVFEMTHKFWSIFSFSINFVNRKFLQLNFWHIVNKLISFGICYHLHLILRIIIYYSYFFRQLLMVSSVRYWFFYWLFMCLLCFCFHRDHFLILVHSKQTPFSSILLFAIVFLNNYFYSWNFYRQFLLIVHVLIMSVIVLAFLFSLNILFEWTYIFDLSYLF